MFGSPVLLHPVRESFGLLKALDIYTLWILVEGHNL
jgi:hypothetical protein